MLVNETFPKQIHIKIVNTHFFVSIENDVIYKLYTFNNTMHVFLTIVPLLCFACVFFIYNMILIHFYFF